MPLNQGHQRYAWLETAAVRSASDIALGALLLAAAAAAVVGTSHLPVFNWEQEARVLPAMIATLLAGVGAMLLARGALKRTTAMHTPHVQWRLWQVALVGAFGAALTFGILWSLSSLPLPSFLLMYGPADYAANTLLLLSIPIVLGRLSRLRATGMVLLGLLLAVVGTDMNTGLSRMTMGLEQLAQGFDFRVVVLPGLVWVADSMVCAVSPRLLLATYTRRIAGWRVPALPATAAAILRSVAVLVIAASGYWTFAELGGLWDVGALLAFGVLGVACKLLTWSRPALLIGFACSWFLEENLRTALLLWRGDAAVFLRSPLSAMLLAATGIILVAAMVLSLRRAFAQSTGAAAP